MGKFREKSRLKNNRYNPCSGKPRKTDKKDLSTELEGIYEKLCSTEFNVHLTALSDLGLMANRSLEDVSAILKFAAGSDLKAKGVLVRQVMAFLSSQEQCVQLEAVGVLRNLSACNSDSHVVLLLEQGVVRPLVSLLKSCHQQCSHNSSDTAAQTKRLAVLEEAAYVINNICEVSDEATMQCCEDAVLDILLHYSSASSAASLLPPSLVLAANTALLCLTEDNPQLCVAVEPHTASLWQQLDSFTPSQSLTDALALCNTLTIAGILINLGECCIHNSSLEKIVCVIASALCVSPTQLLQQCMDSRCSDDARTSNSESDHEGPMDSTSDLGSIGNGSNGAVVNSNSSNDEGPSLSINDVGPSLSINDVDLTRLQKIAETVATDTVTDRQTPSQAELYMELKVGKSAKDDGSVSSVSWKGLQHWLPAQQLAVELLNNLCCGDEDDEAEQGSADETDAAEMKDRKELQNAVLQGVLVQHNVFELVLQSSQQVEPPVLDAIKGSTHYRQLRNHTRAVQVHSLAALQAVLEALTLEQLGGPLKLYQCWTNLAQLAFVDAGHGEEGVLEQATGAMRAVLSRYTPQDAHHLSAITQQDLQVLYSACQSCSIAGVRRNLARLLGVLSCLLLGQGTGAILDPTYSVLRDATAFLLQLSGTDADLSVSAEALDVIIDLYSDDRTDKLALECDLVAHLRRILDYFTARFRKEKKALKAHRPLLTTVNDNLPEFIKYKEPRVLNADPNKKHPRKDATKKRDNAGLGDSRGKCKVITKKQNGRNTGKKK